MLGDPRKLSPADVKKYRSYADWLQLMQTKYDVMSFRQDLPGFSEPGEGQWDGFQRINNDTKSGGIVAIFKHGSIESKRRITVNDLDPLGNYEVKAMNGKVIFSANGTVLRTIGFEVEFSGSYAGELYEIGRK